MEEKRLIQLFNLEYLDVFKKCELQDALFAQSELGDYRSALNKGMAQ